MGKLILSCTLLASCLLLQCFAFDKETHRLISLRAAEIYRACVSRPEFPAVAFAQGAFDEDDKDPLDRIFNWHFYDAGHFPTQERFFETTLGRIFALRVAQFDAAPEDDRWYPAGRVAHYIQDMAAPAHVVPVYHVSLFWPFSVEDTFDSYGRVSHPGGAPEIKDAGLCPPDLAGSTEPRRILDRLAHETLAAVNGPILPNASDAQVRKLTWLSQLWCPPTEPCRSQILPGFGTYRGSKGGESWGVQIDFGCGAGCTVDDAVYRAFFEGRYRAAVRETINWLAAVDRLKRRAGP